MSDRRKDSFSILGIGATACVACCIGPIVAFLGGLGIAGLASTLVIGAGSLAITTAAIVAIVVVRRRRAGRNPGVNGESPGVVTVAVLSRRPSPPQPSPPLASARPDPDPS
jgi:hypothetical protein